MLKIADIAKVIDELEPKLGYQLRLGGRRRKSRRKFHESTHKTAIIGSTDVAASDHSHHKMHYSKHNE